MKAAVTVLLFLSLCGLSFSLYRKHIFVNKITTWTKAQAYCREHHDDLSTVNKEEAKLLSKNPFLIHFFWIGLHKSPTSPDDWIFFGSENEIVDNWDTGQPVNISFQDCVTVKIITSKMYNSKCNWLVPFYCMEVYELILVNQNKTWEEALDYCRQNYNDLVTLTSGRNMAEVINKTITSQTDYVWTGLRFLAGHWSWMSGEDLQYKAWSAKGELTCPARNLRCGALDRVNNIWRPQNCEDKLNFVCLKKL